MSEMYPLGAACRGEPARQRVPLLSSNELESSKQWRSKSRLSAYKSFASASSSSTSSSPPFSADNKKSGHPRIVIIPPIEDRSENNPKKTMCLGEIAEVAFKSPSALARKKLPVSSHDLDYMTLRKHSSSSMSYASSSSASSSSSPSPLASSSYSSSASRKRRGRRSPSLITTSKSAQLFAQMSDANSIILEPSNSERKDKADSICGFISDCCSNHRTSRLKRSDSLLDTTPEQWYHLEQSSTVHSWKSFSSQSFYESACWPLKDVQSFTSLAEIIDDDSFRTSSDDLDSLCDESFLNVNEASTIRQIDPYQSRVQAMAEIALEFFLARLSVSRLILEPNACEELKRRVDKKDFQRLFEDLEFVIHDHAPVELRLPLQTMAWQCQLQLAGGQVVPKSLLTRSSCVRNFPVSIPMLSHQEDGLKTADRKFLPCEEDCTIMAYSPEDARSEEEEKEVTFFETGHGVTEPSVNMPSPTCLTNPQFEVFSPKFDEFEISLEIIQARGIESVPVSSDAGEEVFEMREARSLGKVDTHECEDKSRSVVEGGPPESLHCQSGGSDGIETLPPVTLTVSMVEPPIEMVSPRRGRIEILSETTSGRLFEYAFNYSLDEDEIVFGDDRDDEFADSELEELESTRNFRSCYEGQRPTRKVFDSLFTFSSSSPSSFEDETVSEAGESEYSYDANLQDETPNDEDRESTGNDLRDSSSDEVRESAEKYSDGDAAPSNFENRNDALRFEALRDDCLTLSKTKDPINCSSSDVSYYSAQSHGLTSMGPDENLASMGDLESETTCTPFGTSSGRQVTTCAAMEIGFNTWNNPFQELVSSIVNYLEARVVDNSLVLQVEDCFELEALIPAGMRLDLLEGIQQLDGTPVLARRCHALCLDRYGSENPIIATLCMSTEPISLPLLIEHDDNAEQADVESHKRGIAAQRLQRSWRVHQAKLILRKVHSIASVVLLEDVGGGSTLLGCRFASDECTLVVGRAWSIIQALYSLIRS